MPGNTSEPNGNWTGLGVETCMVGNSSEPVNGTWGWADASCTATYGFICRFNCALPLDLAV